MPVDSSQSRALSWCLGPIYIGALPLLFFFFLKAHFTVSLLVKSPCSVPFSLAPWIRIILVRTEWELRFLTSPAADLFFLAVGASIETDGSFNIMRAWGKGVHVGRFSWHTTIASRSPWHFLKPTSAAFWVRHAALSQCTQIFFFFFPFLCASCPVWHTSVQVFLFAFWNILNFSCILCFCIEGLLRSPFWGWVIWKVAALILKIQCKGSEVIAG